MSKMRVVVFNGADKPLSVEQVDIPRPAGNEVLLKIHRCGICGSDISMTSGGAFDYPAGRRLGHEYAGEVVETGSMVKGLKVGDRVACLPNGFCGNCENCRQGRPLFCTAGKPLSGGMADYLCAPEISLVMLPQSLSFSDGALVEPIACGRKALRSAGFAAGDRLLVLGAGAMAIASIYWARLMGAGDITVLSRSAYRRDVVMAMGADRYLSHEEEGEDCIERLATQVYDVVVECAGVAGMISNAINYVRPAGTVVSLGMCMCRDSFVPAVCAFKEARLVFPVGYSMQDFQQTVRAFDINDIKPGCMVSDTIGLSEVPATFDQLRAGSKKLKVLIDPSLPDQHNSAPVG